MSQDNLDRDKGGPISIHGDAQSSVLITGSHNIVLLAAQEAQRRGRDPTRMLRVVALLAAPVHDPQHPHRPPEPLNLRAEWNRLEQAVCEAKAPILLARLVPPTLDALRRHLSPRVAEQGLFPQVLHFSGHAWTQGLLLEDECGQTHPVTADQLLQTLKLPQPLDLVVLNACETAAEAHSAAQALLDSGLARAVVGHPHRVWDEEAIAFARTLYADLTDGYPLAEAVERAQKVTVTSEGDRHLEVRLLGDGDLRFTGLTRGEPLVDDARPKGNLPAGEGVGFFGRGEELVGLARRLDRPPGLALICGPQGIGKSRLALEAAHRNAWRFPDGVAYAEALSAHPTAAYLFNGLAEALGLMVTEAQEVAPALLAHAHTTATLFVLDNLETLPEAELRILADFLARLGGRSAAIATLRPPLPLLEDIPHAASLSLQEGLSHAAATRYALDLARSKGLPLPPRDAQEIAQATSGHPLLIANIVARARRRDRQALLEEVRHHEGDFAAQVEAVYAWSAERISEAGCRAWQALPLFPAGWVPEAPLRALAGAEGSEALRHAAVADFDPRLQVWRWHPTAAEYAARRWPLDKEGRQERLSATLPAWAGWLDRLPAEASAAHAWLEAALPNLETIITVGAYGRTPQHRGALRQFLRALDGVLPAPDRTLALRAVQEPLYRCMAELAEDEADRARALSMLGYALSALGRREEALAATAEAVEIRRELAAANPQAFRPDLAASLGAHGTVLRGLERHAEAADAFEEGVRVLLPLFRRLPQAFAGLMEALLNEYRAACRAAGREPDELLR